MENKLCANCIYYHSINNTIGTCLINNEFTFKDTNSNIVKKHFDCFIDDVNKYTIKHIILGNLIYNNGIVIRPNVITYINNNSNINSIEDIINSINNSFKNNNINYFLDKIVLAIIDINDNCYKRSQFYTDTEFIAMIDNLINNGIVKVNKIIYDTKIIQSRMNDK